MMTIDHSQTMALIIGVSDFPEDPTINSIPNVLANVQLLKATLVNHDLVGIPESNVYVSLNENKQQIERKLSNIVEITKHKRNTLLIYYCGHGILSSTDYQLYLTTYSTNIKYLETDAINIGNFKKYIKRSLASVKIVILDCCHSGAIIGSMGQIENKLQVEPLLETIPLVEKESGLESMLQGELNKFQGTYVITSFATDEPSMFPVKSSDKPTYFTGKLINIINEGLEINQEYCSLGDIYNEIDADFRNAGLPRPEQSSFKNADLVFFSRNKKYNREKPGDEIAWESTLNKNSKWGYIDFIKQFPYSIFARVAGVKIDELEEEEYWHSALDTNSALSFKDYLFKYPNGKFKAEVNQRLRQLNQINDEVVKNKWICQTWKEDLDRFPTAHIFDENTSDGFCPEEPRYHGILLREKPEDKEDIQWYITLKGNSIFSFRDYLDKYPNGKYRTQANQKLTELTQLDELENMGGFDFLGSFIEGVQYINPAQKGNPTLFMNEREELLEVLQLWTEILRSSEEVSIITQFCHEKSFDAAHLLKKNLRAAIETANNLERSYRSIALFYSNTKRAKAENVSIINVDPAQLKDQDDPRFIEAIKTEISENYNRLDIKLGYSLLVLPGYLGSKSILETWARIVHESNVLLFSDFLNAEAPGDVINLFDQIKPSHDHVHNSHVVLHVNWLVGRRKHKEIDEHEDLYLPPSPALAGKLYSTMVSQVAAVKNYGGINDVDDLRFELNKTQIADLNKLGLIPMIKEYGQIMAYSAKTLFNGEDFNLRTYSVPRLYHYIVKVIIDFLNRTAFGNFTDISRKALMSQIVKFMDGMTGPTKFIVNFAIIRFEQDRAQKDKIYLDISLRPCFPAQTFMLQIAVQKGDNGYDWTSTYVAGK